jgi:transcription termination/antitermination protein NusA
MEHAGLIESFSEFKEFKNIDRATMTNILEEVFRSMIVRKYGADDNYSIIVNTDKGDLEIWREREVVDDEFAEDSFDFDENRHISLSDVNKIEKGFEIGEPYSDEVKLDSFGRRAVLSIRQNLSAKINELEKEGIFGKYKERIGEIVTGEVYQVWKREILILDDDGNELILPKNEQIGADFYKKGDTVKAVIARVELKNTTPLIILSRTSPLFLEKLFEQEVPEIFDGIITIKKIVREPGERAKIAVESYDDRIDPVGACVGVKGSRIHGIVRELRNENIDVINYTSNTQLFISRALSPAKVLDVKINENNKRAEVYLKPDQVSLAIGKGGHNIKLAGKLTGFELDVYRDTDTEVEDVNLEDFSDEIEAWIIDELKRVGCDTAQSVLELSVEDLEKRTDLEVETIKDVISILKAEFE